MSDWRYPAEVKVLLEEYAAYLKKKQYEQVQSIPKSKGWVKEFREGGDRGETLRLSLPEQDYGAEGGGAGLEKE